MKTIAEKQSQIIEQFNNVKTWEERYKLLIEKGKKLKPLPTEFQNDKFKVNGCQSTVYMKAEEKEGKVYFEAHSDALIVNGLISLLLEVYSGEDVLTVVKTEPTFISEIGLESHLSPTRSNGLRAMLKQMKLYAYALSLQASKK